MPSIKKYDASLTVRLHSEHVIQIHGLVPGIACAGAKLDQAKWQAKRPLKDRFPHHERLHLH